MTFTIVAGAVWALVPARGGSKSVPLKNLAPLAGRPLLDYCVRAGQAAAGISRIMCSTDAEVIEQRCRALGIEVLARPPALAGDSVSTFDTIAHCLRDLAEREGAAAETVVLLQPTSPFVLPRHIESCLARLKAEPRAGSVQTVIPCAHNQHAFNQRIVSDGQVRFRFPEERRYGHSKQTKPDHYLFGNLVAFRTQAVLEQETVFAEPSLAVDISYWYGFDADGPADFELGRVLLESGTVTLPFLDGWEVSAAAAENDA